MKLGKKAKAVVSLRELNRVDEANAALVAKLKHTLAQDSQLLKLITMVRNLPRLQHRASFTCAGIQPSATYHHDFHDFQADANHDGMLTKAEFLKLVAAKRSLYPDSHTPAAAAALWQMADYSGRGSVDLIQLRDAIVVRSFTLAVVLYCLLKCL